VIPEAKALLTAALRALLVLLAVQVLPLAAQELMKEMEEELLAVLQVD
jgi:hypothetical protein